MEIIRLKKASFQDAFLLSDIAQKAKAHWDYPKEWLALWKDDLSFTKDYLETHHVYLLKLDQTIIGFSIIIQEPAYFDVEHCWVSPEHIGKGYGAELMNHVLSEPIFANKEFQVLSDPNAVGFYEKFGFKTLKMIASKPKGRELPLMQMTNNQK